MGPLALFWTAMWLTTAFCPRFESFPRPCDLSTYFCRGNVLLVYVCNLTGFLICGLQGRKGPLNYESPRK